MLFIFPTTFELDNVTGNFGVHKLWINDCQDRSLISKQQANKQTKKNKQTRTWGKIHT
jgi:hypothetical protein